MEKKVVISDQGLPYLLKGQLWMYANNLASDISEIENGSVVRIVDERENYVAKGFISKETHILVRIATFNDEEVDDDFLKTKMVQAYQKRKNLMGANITNCRLIYGEADNLGGVTVDRYNDILVCQISSYPMEIRKNKLMDFLYNVLVADGQEINGIYWRNDLKARVKEKLDLYKRWYWHNDKTDGKTIINENGLLLNVDVINGQKTGYFLDQKDNRLLVRKLAQGRKVLDCYCHTGAFGLNAGLGRAKKVDGIDISLTAVKLAEENSRLNNLSAVCHFIQDDVSHYLDVCQKGQYDMIILDPPAFCKSAKAFHNAYNGYKQLNTKAFNLLKSGDILISCSCSHFMPTVEFEKMLREAADEKNKDFSVIYKGTQSADHPLSNRLNESEYLKFYCLAIK
ncbi:MAG: class I SAM-dependent rRNA methyltransferase [Erysipelotrichia bacterium]|nr:class I SAM-dependent rRNA methyltransferase [Erysipelotrichia bacterium]